MKKPAKFAILSITLLSCMLGAAWIEIHHEISGLFKSGPVAKANAEDWSKLEKGMSKDDVELLIGKAEHKFAIGNDARIGNKEDSAETWEYDYTDGLNIFGRTSPKSYVVTFDARGTLSFWRKPINIEDPNKSVHTTAASAPR